MPIHYAEEPRSVSDMLGRHRCRNCMNTVKFGHSLCKDCLNKFAAGLRLLETNRTERRAFRKRGDISIPPHGWRIVTWTVPHIRNRDKPRKTSRRMKYV